MPGLPNTLPPQSVACIAQAAHYYHRVSDVLSEDALRLLVTALATKVENGRNGEIVWNKPDKHGVQTYDIGRMQINSSNIPKLAKIGFPYYLIRYNECVNIFAGTRMLQEAIASTPNLWVGIARYNSATPEINAKYQLRVWKSVNELWAQR